MFTQSIAWWDAQAKASPTANAREAVQTLQAANTQFPPTRDVWLNLGEAWAWLAQLEPANATPLRDQARAAYDQAAALSPLKADHAAARSAVP